MLWNWVIGIAGVALVAHLFTKNAVWGSATLGFVVGLVVAWMYSATSFDWWLVAKVVAVFVYVGVALEWLPRLAGTERAGDVGSSRKND